MKWEYRCEPFHARDKEDDIQRLEELLNSMGQKGWKWVGIDSLNSLHIFERPVQGEKEQPAENV
jgi:ribulose bisphosphate carboxylase small subunit